MGHGTFLTDYTNSLMLPLLYHEIWTYSTVILYANSTMRFGVHHT